MGHILRQAVLRISISVDMVALHTKVLPQGSAADTSQLFPLNEYRIGLSRNLAIRLKGSQSHTALLCKAATGLDAFISLRLSISSKPNKLTQKHLDSLQVERWTHSVGCRIITEAHFKTRLNSNQSPPPSSPTPDAISITSSTAARLSFLAIINGEIPSISSS